jgi:hypothetical protein
LRHACTQETAAAEDSARVDVARTIPHAAVGSIVKPTMRWPPPAKRHDDGARWAWEAGHHGDGGPHLSARRNRALAAADAGARRCCKGIGTCRWFLE